MSKKIFQISFFVLLLSAGIIVLTQESDDFDPALSQNSAMEEGEDADVFAEDFSHDFEFEKEVPEWVKPARWFRSNAGGMALEEIPSRLAALRGEYALVIDYTGREELPEYLLPYYDDDFFIEIRIFYEKGEETRTQWIFRDSNATARLVAVFTGHESENTKDSDEVVVVDDNVDDDENKDDYETSAFEDSDDSDSDNENSVEEEKNNNDKTREHIGGFIEIYDKNSFLTAEYNFFYDGGESKTEYIYKDGIVISAAAFLREENGNGGEYVQTHSDLFRYNRSSFLRAVERVFYRDRQISSSDDSIRLAFPGNILDAARNVYFMGEKLNSYPEFFGDIYINKDNKLIFTTDERGRVLTQTLYNNDKEESIIWVIESTWSDERIVSIVKTEGDTELLAEYEYDKNGDRVLERNLRNGALERLVRTEGKKDIEELYFNNIIVLRAVWEDGRKVSETRVRRN